MRTLIIYIVCTIQVASAQNNKSADSYLFQHNDWAIYFTHLGYNTMYKETHNMNTYLINHNYPTIYNKLSGPSVGSTAAYGTHLKSSLHFNFYEADSTYNDKNITIHGGSSISFQTGYAIFKNKYFERFNIIPKLGIYAEKETIRLHEITNHLYTLKTHEIGCLRHLSIGHTISLQVNARSNTKSMLDLFYWGLELGTNNRWQSKDVFYTYKENNILMNRVNLPNKKSSLFFKVHCMIDIPFFSNLYHNTKPTTFLTI